MMTVTAAFMGLMPIMWSTGTGADVMKRIAAPMVGGLVTSFLLELLVYPPIYLLWRWHAEVKPAITAGPRSPGEAESIDRALRGGARATAASRRMSPPGAQTRRLHRSVSDRGRWEHGPVPGPLLGRKRPDTFLLSPSMRPCYAERSKAGGR